MIPLFSIPPFVVSLSMVTMGAFFFLKNPRVKLHRLFACCAASLAIWAFGYGLMYATTDPTKGLFYARLGYLGVVFIPTFFIHFVLEFLELQRPKIIAAVYTLSLVFLVISRLDIFLVKVHRYFWGFYPIAGPVYLYFVIFFYACCGACVYYLLKVYRALRRVRDSSLKLNQVKYVLLAFFIASLSLSDYLPNYYVGVYPFAYLVAFGWLVFIAYGTFKYRVMDINLIIRKTLIYSTVVGTFIALYLVVIMAVTRLFQGLTGYQTAFSSAAAAAIISFCFQPLRKRVQYFVDSKFFRQYVDREEKLYELSREVITHTTPEAMARSLIRVLGDTLHPKSAAIYLRSREGDGFALISEKGANNIPERMPENNPLTNYFIDHPQPFIQQDLPAEIGEPVDTRRPPRKEEAA